MKSKQLLTLAWGITTLSVILAIFAWGQGNSWEIIGISSYQLFPLFGLLAFSLMWGHYVMSALRIRFGIDKTVLKTYFETTSLAVLGAILLHPGLLAWQLWRDGLGLPPSSELNFVASSLKGAVILGMLSLTMFLVYEFRRLYQDKMWWKYVQLASDVAILLIVIHSLRLGSNLQAGWFKSVWFLYTITLLGSIIYIYSNKLKNSKKHKPTLVKP